MKKPLQDSRIQAELIFIDCKNAQFVFHFLPAEVDCFSISLKAWPLKLCKILVRFSGSESRLKGIASRFSLQLRELYEANFSPHNVLPLVCYCPKFQLFFLISECADTEQF